MIASNESVEAVSVNKYTDENGVCACVWLKGEVECGVDIRCRAIFGVRGQSARL